jgi:toxin-antitoxin system, antitoxin component, xre family
MEMGLEKINEYKKKLGITTDELSRLSGVPVGTLNKILSGATKDPKLETLKAIARVLGLTLNDFDDTPHASTIAAHFDGKDFTEEEIEDIRAYAEFVKNRRK